MSTQTPPPSTFGQRLFEAFMRLLRAVLLLLLLVAFGAFLFWSIPKAYNALVLPLQEHTARIEDLQTQQDQLSAQLIEQNAALLQRIQELETARDADKQTIADLQAALERMQSDLDALNASQSASQQQLDASLSKLDALQADLSALDAQLSSLQQDVQSTQEGVTLLSDYLASQEAPVAVLYREVQLVKAMELLTRSRIFLTRNDLGKAKQDVQDAYAILNDLKTMLVPAQMDALDAILQRLDLVLQDFDQNPSLLQDDMESAWRLLLAGLPENRLPVTNDLQIVVTPSVELSTTLEYPPEPGETLTGTLEITTTESITSENTTTP